MERLINGDDLDYLFKYPKMSIFIEDDLRVDFYPLDYIKKN